MKRIDAWLFAPGSARQLAAVRIGLCGILALRLTRTVYVGLAEQPSILFRPRSFMNLFPHMPPRASVLGVQVIGLIAAVLALVGWRARTTLPFAWACGVFLGGMTTSLGKVVHNDVLLLLAMVPLLVAPVSDVWARDARGHTVPPDSERYGFAWRAALVVVAGGYFFAGVAKVVNSGLDWVTGENMRWVMYASSDGSSVPNDVALFIADRPWLAHAVAAATLLFELGFVLVLWSARARPWFIAATIGLHAGIWFAMRLNYWPQAATVAVVLTDWPAVLRRVRARARTKPSPRAEASASP